MIRMTRTRVKTTVRTSKRGHGAATAVSPACYVSGAYHVFAFGLYLFTLYYDFVIRTPVFMKSEYMIPGILTLFNGSVAYKSVFITIWSSVFQLLYFFICCVSDLVTSSGAHSPFTRKIAAFRDWFLAAVAFPIGTLVVTIFWAIWAIDRELIFPKVLDNFFPSWLNHLMHTTVLPILILDMFLVKHRYPSRLNGILGMVVVALSYLSWILWLGFVADIWVYPFLQVLDGAVFVGFIVVSALSLIVIYIIGEKVSNIFWRGYADYDIEMDKLD